LGGGFPISAERAREAVTAIADALEMSLEETAAGIVRLIDDAMAKVLRIVTVERGLDPRDFSLVAFGGGGPLHACALAAELGIEKIIVPPHPGLFSASGLLEAPLAINELQAILCVVEEIELDAVEHEFRARETRARAMLLEQGADEATIVFRREYDARYGGQSFELTIPYDSLPSAVAERFHEAHRARYGYDTRDATVEIVNARLTASARVGDHFPRVTLSEPRVTLSGVEGRHGTTRNLWLDGSFVEAPVYARDALADDTKIEGPAILEDYDSTTYVAPGWRLQSESELLIMEPAR
ncbi:MAG TPA: hydantoinase/oxoprolinase family protein, partial [Candidatus Nitrosotalea sp.]|nr:hydantoinase/oxoprolinase family protein [Candidatus Nitrosotalea sp.]